MRKTQLLFICFFILSTVLSAQTNLKKANWEWNISQDGLSRQLIFKGKRSNDTIPFFSGKRMMVLLFMSGWMEKNIKRNGYLTDMLLSGLHFLV